MGAIKDQVAFLTLDLGARKCAEYIEQLEAKLTDCCDAEELRARTLAQDLEVTRAELKATREHQADNQQFAELRKELAALRGELAALRTLKPGES